MQTAYVTHPACLLHDLGEIHPDVPARLGAIQDQLIASQLFDWLLQIEAPAASRVQLERVHDSDYIDFIEANVPESGTRQLDADTALMPHSLNAARHAAGAVIAAVDAVMAGRVQNAFCAVRPPGHHAERARAMGFCIFNNIAAGTAHALEVYGLERVAVVDFDVHHGNGTEDIFRHDPRVMICSAFQHPFYPGTPFNHDNPRQINVPLERGARSDTFRKAVAERILPALDAFAPQMIFVSAGFDGHRLDDMSGLILTAGDYAWITQMLQEKAKAHACGRLISSLEGGYDLPALADSVAAHLRILMEI